DRYDMVKAAIADNYKLEATDIEFQLPRPSYTIDTLTHLVERNPGKTFRVIMGEDNLVNFEKWKNYKEILDRYGLYVYPRPGVTNSEPGGDVRLKRHPNVKMIDAPLLDISATYIRNCIKDNKSIRYLVPEAVEEMIRMKNFYR
ncbi:MAG TPA: nicotinate (nicotinamide) nucleotide adenylyltransferase, partial [Cyclobacteriaceae bacterium]